MTTPDEELEAAIWRAMTDAAVTCPDPLGFIDDIKDAARCYSAGDSPAVTRLRRQVLHRGAAEHISPSTRGGATGTAPELNPPGSGAFPQGAGDGGATRSTRASIPGAVTSRNAPPSTPVDDGYSQGVDR